MPYAATMTAKRTAAQRRRRNLVGSEEEDLAMEEETTRMEMVAMRVIRCGNAKSKYLLGYDVTAE